MEDEIPDVLILRQAAYALELVEGDESTEELAPVSERSATEILRRAVGAE